MRYEIATLTIKLGAAAKVVSGVDSYVKAPDARGKFLGCWISEIGELNQVFVLRSFADDAELWEERWRGLGAVNAFECGDAITDLTFDSYAPFPFLPQVTPGKYGDIYEIRTYWLKHGGVPPTIAAWEAAVPRRTLISPLVVAMYALDGAARFTHIWPFASLDIRAAARAEAVTRGVWPPPGGPEWLTGEMRSTIGIPTAISPLA
jgi:hypothetical protein